MIVGAGLVLWYCIGVAGFVFWFTKDHDIGIFEAVVGLFAGIMGPFAWPFGYWIHGDRSKPIVLIKKRRR